MTLDSADKIAQFVVDTVARQSAQPVRRKSELRGHAFEDITKALKLRVAREYRQCANDPSAYRDFLKRVDSYDVVNISVWSEFVDDHKVQAVASLDPASREHKIEMLRLATSWQDPSNHEYQKWLKQETITSFANYCRSIGADDEDYWQKVYAHLGLAYQL